MHNFIWPALLTVGAGVSVFIQQVLNANLRAELTSAAWSGFMSYLLGVICMVCLAIALRDPLPSGNTIARVPWWAWSGGIFGDIFIALSIITIPKLGGAAYIARRREGLRPHRPPPHRDSGEARWRPRVESQSRASVPRPAIM